EIVCFSAFPRLNIVNYRSEGLSVLASTRHKSPHIGMERRRRLRSSLLLLCSIFSLSQAFNLDTNGPIYKKGPAGAHFGYSVASHFNGKTPVILVGAPKGESGQVGTSHAGALFSCPIASSRSDCKQIRSEYEDVSAYDKRPDQISSSRAAYYLGKNNQLFGASVASQGKHNGTAIVCAPLMTFSNESAYVFGSCYHLKSDLSFLDQIVSCESEGLETRGRHNEYSACLQGHSSYIDDDYLVTGLVGARKWTGGVYARTQPKNLFDTSDVKHTMFDDKNEERLLSTTVFRSHDYVGYSVKMGRFGFAHEDSERQSIVSGATRYGQHGAVVVLPFQKKVKSKRLLMTEDQFVLNGTQLGSGFGYAIEVIDLNNDGFDDLLVSAPFERYTDEEGVFGGTVRVYYAKGASRDPSDLRSSSVFDEPIVLRKSDLLSQFGISIAKLGNLDGDLGGFQDFAVGAPFANEGAGVVYIYHGAANRETFSIKPVQTISASSLSLSGLRAFGFSLSGAVDVDSNGYPDLAVGVALSDTVAIFRSRPVIRLKAEHLTDSEYIEIDRKSGCPSKSQTCFKLKLSIEVEHSESTKLINLNENVFTCTLEVLEFEKGKVPRRALIAPSDKISHTWACGRNAHKGKVEYDHTVFIPSDEASSDWLNPLKLKFSAKLLDERKPEIVREGRSLPDLQQYPMLDRLHSSHEFTVPFNTRCGSDQKCQTDLSMKAVLDGISQQDNIYVLNVGEKEHLDVDFVVENKGEKAYGAALWLSYDPEELELPTLERRGADKKKTGALILETHGENMTHVRLGNPMNQETTLQFTIRFKLVRGRSQSVGRPIIFEAKVNSSSEETHPEDNEWRAQLRIIKKAELELTGASDPPLIRFGGDVKGESAMELEEDIGTMVRHNYTLHNKGRWTVRNVTAKFQWPYQVASGRRVGKWALYLLDVPTVTTHQTDGTVDIKPCTVEVPAEDYVNPVESIRRNTRFSTMMVQPVRLRNKRSADSSPSSAASSQDPLAARFAFGSPSSDRVKPETRKEGDFDVQVTTISCGSHSARCFDVICHLDYIDANSAPVIDFRARIWNSTFVEDYFDVEYVELMSYGSIEIDINQGLDDDPSNNQIAVKTLAYPDKPSIDDARPIPWWVYAAAALAGLLILLVLVFLLWKCGFFKRKEFGPTLQRAQLHHERELWSQS
ncbi:ina-1, partial [Pristionchus pacificus]|uniref:Ina-1 n=1 Tax=Pristionchus pacificus TaxID=54126 RepID=A0A2A6BQ80_PRIPA